MMNDEEFEHYLVELADEQYIAAPPIDAEELADLADFDNEFDVHLSAGEALPDDVFAVTPAERETPCHFLSGSAGTGKTFEIMRRLQADPKYAVVSASTGIAAVNLNATTINSLLGYFDTAALRDAYLSGAAQRSLVRSVVKGGYRNVVIDEVSMISHQTLDLIVAVFDDVNLAMPPERPPIGLILVGDQCQLPPISDDKNPDGSRRKGAPTPWSFNAKTWHRFENNITRLTKVWRQADPRYQAALNHARNGEGQQCVSALQASGVTFHTACDVDYDGTTIVPDNDGVDRHNRDALKRLDGTHFMLPARRWGRQRGEWKNIPDKAEFAEGAYVMLLANKRTETGMIGSSGFEYVNGDCGHIAEVPTRDPSAIGEMPPIKVRLVRNNQIVSVRMITRGFENREKPIDFPEKYQQIEKGHDVGEYIPYPHYRGQARTYVSGQVEYYPIRLAYASTVHKVQGLSLDKVQIDFRHWMFSRPGMVYVAMSRCRTVEGLRVVGQPDVIAARCKVDPAVKRWL